MTRHRHLSLALLLLLALASPAWGACTGSSPTWTSTPDFASVNSCVGSASSGDTINVSAGSATWSNGITITNTPVSIIGAGIGSTTITSSYTASYLISYSPTVTTSTLFRVSGFTFDMSNNQAIGLSLNNTFPPITQVRIDHNRFTNSTHLAGGIEVFGVRGLVDNNTFDHVTSPVRNWGSSGSGAWDWTNFPELVWGTANDSMYYEDNTFSVTAGVYMITDCDQAGRYVFRYNTFTAASDTTPWMDLHGGSSSGTEYGCFGGEAYGNTYNHGGDLISQRGGRSTWHHNTNSAGTADINLYFNDGACPNTVQQQINKSYHFLNRAGLTGAVMTWTSSGGDTCFAASGGARAEVVQNSTFWMDASPFDGTAGIGAGTLGARPATCTTGVGYWATTQSVSDLTGMVGPSPATPIAGTLYRCTSTNVWAAYYTPLTYPHPLRGGAKSPSPPGSLSVR